MNDKTNTPEPVSEKPVSRLMTEEELRVIEINALKGSEGAIIIMATEIHALLAALRRTQAESSKWKEKAEQADGVFDDLEREVSKVYLHITNGKFSKINTMAEYIIQEHDDALERLEAERDSLKLDISCQNEIGNELVIIAFAAHHLELWLTKNVGDTADWPVEIKADNDHSAMHLASLLTELKRALVPYRKAIDNKQAALQPSLSCPPTKTGENLSVIPAGESDPS